MARPNNFENIIMENKNRYPENKFCINEDYYIGYDKNNRIFYFDISDYKKISIHKWHVDKNNEYVSTTINEKNIFMHRFLLNVEDEKIYVDHKNQKRYDNRKNNLRIADHQKNIFNQKIKTTNKSGVTGVNWHKKYLKWRAYICINSKHIDLGRFDDFEKAVKCRLKAELKYFADFAPQQHLFEKYNIKER
jgi:hypothetical protein